jgi:uncharacterized protein (DUF2267 family)
MTVEDFLEHANYMRDTDEYTAESFTPAQLDTLHDLLNESVTEAIQAFIEGIE